MSVDMEAAIFLAYAAGVLAVCLFGHILVMPMKHLLKLLLNSLAGGVVLAVLNTVGTGLGIQVPLNVLTCAAAGLLGAPGVAGMILFFNWMI